MQSKTLVVLSAVATLGVSSIAMARGGAMAMHASGSGIAMHGHSHFGLRHFGHRFHFVKRFNRNLFLLGGWGLGGDYGDSGYGSTTVVAFPQATPQVTGSISTGPCHWNEETFNVPSSAGGTRPVQVVNCR